MLQWMFDVSSTTFNTLSDGDATGEQQLQWRRGKQCHTLTVGDVSLLTYLSRPIFQTAVLS